MSDHSVPVIDATTSSTTCIGVVDDCQSSIQLKEYENQLSDVNDLLELSPDDETLQTLKSDLTELINITRQQQVPSTNDNNTSINKRPNDNGTEDEGVSFVDVLTDAAKTAAEAAAAAATTDNTNEESNQKVNKKQKIKNDTIIKDFEIPNHLLPNEADTENERNKKRRAIKGLKNKWNEKRKDIVSTQKQQAWQSFNNKKSSTKHSTTNSIFSTTGNNKNNNLTSTTTKVGVVIAPSSITTTNNRHTAAATASDYTKQRKPQHK